MNPITSSEFAEAHKCISPHICRTPLLTSEAIQNRSNHSHVFFKCENFQKTGSFKIRGATNAVLSSLTNLGKVSKCSPTFSEIGEKNNKSYFITHSSGNHGQAVALAAKNAGAASHIIVPRTAPKSKIAGIIEYGATLHICEPTLKSREEACAQVERDLKMKDPGCTVTFIHPFDNPLVICGQGTIALEIISQVGEAMQNGCEASSSSSTSISDVRSLGAIVVPTGGGGMLSGIAMAAKALNPSIKIFGAEPAAANDVARGLATGQRQTLHVGNVVTPNTIADGLMTFTSERTFGVIQKFVDGVIEVTEEEIREAFQLVFEKMKIVIEPSAAVGVAALLKNDPRLSCVKGAVAVVICGGNVDFDKISTFGPAKL